MTIGSVVVSNMDISFDEVITLENVYFAWRRFQRGKSQRMDVAVFERDLERNLLQLWSDLECGAYRHGAYQSFELKDSKRRRIDKATVRDRVVHEMLFRILQDIFEPRFISDSYSSRTGKGTLRALAKANMFLSPWRRGLVGWHAVVCDVRSFFATVPHSFLLERIAEQVKDSRLFTLLQDVIQSFSTMGTIGFGIPLGNVTSQIFANIVLHNLDWKAKMNLRLRRYIRYNDDVLVVIFGTRQAQQVGFILKDTVRTMGCDLKVNVISLEKRTRFDWLGAAHSFSGRCVRPASAKRIEKAIKKCSRRHERRYITTNIYRSMLTSYRAHEQAYSSFF